MPDLSPGLVVDLQEFPRAQAAGQLLPDLQHVQGVVMDSRTQVAKSLIDAANHPTCSHKVNGERCGKRASCVIKTHGGRLLQEPNPKDKFEDDRPFGIGVGSTWTPICEEHKACYPDHEGFELDGSTKLS